MFQPPRCPNRLCTQFRNPEPGFYQHHGSYSAKCRPHPIPRFLCKACRRSFSRQTFRMDYYDHKPHINSKLYEYLASGVGLRQSARMLGLSRSSIDLKARKIGRHLRRLHLNLCGPFEPESVFQLDEFETYEGRRNTRPLTLPILIERTSRFIIWAESAPIRPRGKMTAKREAAMQADERRFGRRRDLSRSAVRRTLARGAKLTKELEKVRLETDEKSTYPLLAAQAFGQDRLEHEQTNSRLARTIWNPLFPINSTEAMARDLSGRLRRDSWLVSKARRYLDIALHVFITYRNYVRRRFNGEESSAAQEVGFLPRRLKVRELLSWRQDGGELSIHPLARRESIVEWKRRYVRPSLAA